MSSTASVKLSKGAVVKEKWVVNRMLGEGGCGVVYEVVCDKANRAALKVESLSDKKEDEILKMEVHVLRKLQGKKNVCELLGCGRTDSFNFIVMSLLGANLADLRRLCPEQRFTTSTCCRLGLQSLEAIKDVHSTGYVHRDIKPSNFALGGTEKTKRTIYIFDFGLARLIETETPDGKRKLREPRSDVAFRGTIRYCSLNVHLRKEQGKHDDLWSFLYMLVELQRGYLPWRNKGKEGSKDVKQNISDKALLEKCPKEYMPMLKHLRTLTYKRAPDYKLLAGQLRALMSRNRYLLTDPFDWERGGRYYKHFEQKDEQSLSISEHTDDELMKRDTDSAPDTIQEAEDLEPDSAAEDTRRDVSDMSDISNKSNPVTRDSW